MRHRFGRASFPTIAYTKSDSPSACLLVTQPAFGWSPSTSGTQSPPLTNSGTDGVGVGREAGVGSADEHAPTRRTRQKISLRIDFITHEKDRPEGRSRAL